MLSTRLNVLALAVFALTWGNSGLARASAQEAGDVMPSESSVAGESADQESILESTSITRVYIPPVADASPEADVPPAAWLHGRDTVPTIPAKVRRQHTQQAQAEQRSSTAGMWLLTVILGLVLVFGFVRWLRTVPTSIATRRLRRQTR